MRSPAVQARLPPFSREPVAICRDHAVHDVTHMTHTPHRQHMSTRTPPPSPRPLQNACNGQRATYRATLTHEPHGSIQLFGRQVRSRPRHQSDIGVSPHPSRRSTTHGARVVVHHAHRRNLGAPRCRCCIILHREIVTHCDAPCVSSTVVKGSRPPAPPTRGRAHRAG